MKQCRGGFYEYKYAAIIAHFMDTGVLDQQCLSLYELHLAVRRALHVLKENPVISMRICQAWINPT